MGLNKESSDKELIAGFICSWEYSPNSSLDRAWLRLRCVLQHDKSIPTTPRPEVIIPLGGLEDSNQGV
jgi:hypothetical protein